MTLLQSRRQLFEPIMRFRVHLTKRRARKFDLIWNSFYNTKAEEMDNQPDVSPAESEKRKQMLVGLLESIRQFVSES